MRGISFATACFFFIALAFIPTIATGEENEPQCTKIPPLSGFGIVGAARVTGLSVVAGCERLGSHLFIVEVLPSDNEETPQLHMRFAVKKEMPEKERTNLLWMEKKLLRIKRARAATGRYLKKSQAWAIFYEKVAENGSVVPTIAVVKMDQENKTVAARVIRFNEAQRFFSPLLFDRDGSRIIALWGEWREGSFSILKSSVDVTGKQERPVHQILVSGNLRDRFVAAYQEGKILLAWLEETTPKDCLDLFVGKFGEEEATPAGKIFAGRFCNDILLVGIRETPPILLVDVLEGSKGNWKSLSVVVDHGLGESKTIKNKTPAVPYDSDFVVFPGIVLQKKRYSSDPVLFSFMGKEFPVSTPGAMAPLALSLCEKEAVGGWVEADPSTATRIAYFDVMFVDSDADGILDDLDACSAGTPNAKME